MPSVLLLGQEVRSVRSFRLDLPALGNFTSSTSHIQPCLLLVSIFVLENLHPLILHGNQMHLD